MYWKYDDFEGKPFDGYPKDMRLWKGVKLPVDAAFTSFDGLLAIYALILLQCSNTETHVSN